MFLVIGYAIAIVCVFGAYVGMGGHLGALYQPLELVLIGGAAVGAFIAGNNMRSLKMTLAELPRVLRRVPYDKERYLEIMACVYALLNKAKKESMVKLESDIEKPESSAIFQKYPTVLNDPKALHFIVDYFRIMISGKMSAPEIEALMDEELETARHESNTPVKALRAVGDALPAFGIVAAVLGVIKALAAVDQEAYILADLISKAMVGTFLGILLAYAFVFPLAETLDRRSSEARKAIECIKISILAYLNGYEPPFAVEFGRKVLFEAVRPSFTELEERVRAARSGKSG